jgi:phage terminase small subunit
VALTPKQERFVAEYLIDLNATQAAIRAGYSADTANQQGPRLLVNVGIKAAIDAAMVKRAAKHDVTVDRIVSELAKLGFANMADYMVVGDDGLPRLNWSALSRDQAAALTEVTVEQVGDVKVGQLGDEEVIAPVHKVKFKLADKRGALVDLGRHLNMFVERHEHSGQVDFASLLVEARARAKRRA